MANLDDVLTAVCRLPLDFRGSRSSAHDLIVKSGYLALRREITVEHLYDRLALNQQLVDAWQLWSDDNRGWPAWYIESVGPGNGKFEVGYYDNGKTSQRLFDDRNRACAEYAHHTLEQLADQAATVPFFLSAIRGLLRSGRR